MKFPALAAVLRALASGGPKAFYEGAPAEDIVATLAPRGSFLTRDDFARHRGEVAEPIASNYRGLDVVELPPNGQGLAALVLLNILEPFELAALDPSGAERLHIQLEAARLAYAVRDSHVADPAFMRMSVPALLDKGFARGLADRIDRRKRVPLPPAPTPASHTVLVTVVDRDRTAVTLINSLFASFGTAIATEKTGILLHNRGSGFVVDPAHPNTIGPAKRPMHTIIPALGMRDGRCDLAFGVMGGGYQAMGHAHFVVNLIDYGMDLQTAIDHPRVFFAGETTEVERGVPAAAIEGLEGARPRRQAASAAVRRRAGDPDRLGTRHADRRLRPSQGRLCAGLLEHDCRKVGTGFRKRSCSNNKPERDDDLKKSHPALEPLSQGLVHPPVNPHHVVRKRVRPVRDGALALAAA